MTMVTPVGAFVFRKYIQVKESGRDLDIPKSEAATEDEETMHG